MSKQITKSYLEYLGVTKVTPDGRVFTKRGEISPRDNGHGYQQMGFRGCKEGTKPHNVYIHYIVYAWFHSEVPYGKEIHHIDRNPLNNSIDNLEALNPEEHRAKHESTLEEKCRLDIPREHYVKKIAEYQAKGAYSAAGQYKRRLRYYDSHIEEANELVEFKKDLMELRAWKEVFKENNNKKLWHQCCTLEKMVKAKGLESKFVIKHALDVARRHFGRGSF